MADAITFEDGRDSQAVFNKANVVGFLVAVATSSFYSFSASEGSALAKDYLSEVLQSKHFELLVYVLMILHGAAMSTASRSFPAISKTLLGASEIVLTMYVNRRRDLRLGTGSPLGRLASRPVWGLRHSRDVPADVLRSSPRGDIRRIRGEEAYEFSVRERKREGLVRMLGSAWQIWCWRANACWRSLPKVRPEMANTRKLTPPSVNPVLMKPDSVPGDGHRTPPRLRHPHAREIVITSALP